MDRERWERIEALCEMAQTLAGEQRGLALERACAGDRELMREVLSLLEQLDAAPEFLERPVIGRANFVLPDADVPATGTAIGPYRLERLLGRGGMGEVYLAVREFDGVVQHVALKVIRRGMDTDEVLRRFRLERRILASLHHPNVAQLIDAAATDDGRPYFVMEYIEGQPLTQFCDERRLPIRDRLRLFLAICGAVQHAHQQLVVHRDLKPRNILVTPDGVPKLLDFGIGKVLDEGFAFGSVVDTRTDLRLLTPEYAAPEQVTGANVTTATDVYSLGVMLYEVLSGRHPYATGKGSRQDMERAVLETVPDRPSLAARRTPVPSQESGDGDTRLREIAAARSTEPEQLRRRLAGDLDTIILKALRKEPERRYPSAAALADDIRRHLDGLPVSARPDTLGYRARKFVGRNAPAVVAGSAVFLGLAIATGVSAVQSRRVAREAQRAEQERDKALEVRGFLMEMFGASGADQAVGDTVTARSLLDRQRAQITTAYGDRPVVRADMQEVLADGYDRLGLYADAEPLAREALALRRQLLPAGHPDVATSLNLLGWIVHERGRSQEGEALLIDAVRIRRADSVRLRDGLSRSLNDLGVVYNAQQRYGHAERVLREALALRQSLFGDGHRAVGITANNLAAALYFQQKLDSAIRVQDLAVRSLQASVGEDHQRTVVALNNLAAFKRARGDLVDAESDYRELAARQTRLQGREHPVTARVLISLAIVLTDRGTKEKSDSLLAEAESLYREAIAALEKRLGPQHPQVGQFLDRLSGVLLTRGRPREAVETQIRALAILRATSADTSRAVQQAAMRLARAHNVAGDSTAARAVQRHFSLKP